MCCANLGPVVQGDQSGLQMLLILSLSCELECIAAMSSS